ncbi:tautomerase [Natrialbaceae archaeon GCM10025810]|uniref:tautomerase n=1 Tax=Halovalidus salilacus TaxID=3075124 RepID=UPI00361450BE
MPLLQFDASFPIADADAEAFAETVTDLYVEEMETSSGHVAVTIRDEQRLSIGRQEGDRLVFLDAEIRRGRNFDRKRAFALAVMDEIVARFDVPEPNVKVVFTEHAGENMMGYDRVGGEWNPDEAE